MFQVRTIDDALVAIQTMAAQITTERDYFVKQAIVLKDAVEEISNGTTSDPQRLATEALKKAAYLTAPPLSTADADEYSA